MVDILQAEEDEDIEESGIPLTLSEMITNTHFRSPIAPQEIALTDEEKVHIIAERFRDIMEVLGLDINDPSLMKTPQRVAKMYVEEAFSGLNPKNFPPISLIEDRYQHNNRANIVLVQSSFCSFCEHHFVPMHGIAHVAYVPNGKLIGLSKITRVVRYFARRPQLQERLTAQIADSLSLILQTDHIAVSIKATHDCMLARGIKDHAGNAITQVLRGNFDTDDTLRNQFFEALRNNSE
jgi:GTP cyclohydrolase I